MGWYFVWIIFLKMALLPTSQAPVIKGDAVIDGQIKPFDSSSFKGFI
jgi:hypothetical protein